MEKLQSAASHSLDRHNEELGNERFRGRRSLLARPRAVTKNPPQHRERQFRFL